MNIRDIIDNLNKEQHLQLMEAFNNGLSDYIEYEPNHFIGVNIEIINFPKLQITETRGKWCIGVISQ